MNNKELNIEDMIDERPFSALGLKALIICALIVVIDGFDTQAIGFAASAISQSLDIPLSSFGPVFSAGLFGAMLGAISLGPLADRFGRKPVLLSSIVLFSVFTVLTVLCTSVIEFSAARFIAGLGLGGAIPNVIALCSEYSPKRSRGMAIGLLYAGFPLGGMISGLLTAKLIPSFGWESIFLVGGLAPIVLIAITWSLLPESWQHLARKKNESSHFRRLMKQLDPDYSIDRKYVLNEKKISGVAVRQLFAEGRGGSTLLLWVPFFMIMLMLIVMVIWTPSLLKQAGITLEQAAIITALINLGSAIGTALIGRLIDKVGPYHIIPVVILLGALSIAPIGYLGGLPFVMAASAIAGGFFVGSAASGLLVLAALTYPASMRATGVGWAYSVGRVGQVVGPLVAGWMLLNGVKVEHIFVYCMVPAAISIFALLWIRIRSSRSDIPLEVNAANTTTEY